MVVPYRGIALAKDPAHATSDMRLVMAYVHILRERAGSLEIGERLGAPPARLALYRAVAY